MKPTRLHSLLAFAIATALLAATPSGFCAPNNAARDGAKDDGKKTTAPAPAPQEEAPPVYEPRLLRLAEILGALAYLQDLCKQSEAQPSGQIWRSQMTALMDAEGKTPQRKERLAGAYNRGFRDYEFTYQRCTPNAQAIIARFLSESGEIAREIAQHNGSW
jgi:uncharacterized protein (TIGR02301 family)